MSIFHLALSHWKKYFWFFLSCVPYVTFKPPAHQKSCINISFHCHFLKRENSEERKKIRWHPCSPKAEAFFSFECGFKLFSQSHQRATTSPQSFGTAEGVEPVGEGHSSHSTHKRPASGRGGGEILHLKGVFSSTTRVHALYKGWPVKQKSEMHRGKNKCAISFMRFGGCWMFLKAVDLVPKKTFSNNIKGLLATARFRKFYCSSHW